MHDAAPRDALEQSLSRLTDRTLSRFERVAHALLLFFAGAIAGAAGYLLVLEPELPDRARWPVAGMLVFALAWVVVAIVVFLVRLPAFADRGVIAARVALGFSALFTVGVAVFSQSVGGRAVPPAAVDGAVVVCVSLALMVRAQRRVAALRAVRARLERELAEAR
jgi:hypothetical protein